uniref:Uncharacterized protein n=1 Tax=Glossina austeni TaxID=7395 RepID=A0A1A9VE00_GLOAU
MLSTKSLATNKRALLAHINFQRKEGGKESCCAAFLGLRDRFLGLFSFFEFATETLIDSALMSAYGDRHAYYGHSSRLICLLAPYILRDFYDQPSSG